MNVPPIPTRVTAEQGDAYSMPEGRLSKQVLNTAGLEVRWYRPPSPDQQSPHDRDEVYVVVTGQGEFVRDAVRCVCNFLLAICCLSPRASLIDLRTIRQTLPYG